MATATDMATILRSFGRNCIISCRALLRGKMVAVIGLGRASDGSLLSSEDLEILRTVSGYIAVAVENSRLYEEQQQHADELALLKEFNESIVESVNVGLLAVDEDGRIIRCNSPFEEMIGLGRENVVGLVWSRMSSTQASL